MPSKFPCLGQKKLKYNATYPCSKGFLQSFIKLRSHNKALILSMGATALSPRGLSFPSDGESLPAISSVGAGATLVYSAAVQESLQQARQQIWVLPFLPVKSLVQLFQNSIVV